MGKKEKHFLTKKKAQKSHFPKRVNPRFWSKKCQVFLYLISVKTRLVIVLLNDFLEKKETFLSIRKNNFSKSKKSLFFFKGVNPLLLAKKCQFFSLFKFDQTKPRNNAFRLCRGKNFFGPKKHNFSKSQKRTFSKGLTHAFGQKMPFFSLFTFGQHKTNG